MKKLILPALAAMMVGVISTPSMVFAEEDTLAKEEQAAEPTKDRSEWVTALKNQHHLTDEQIKTMQDKGLSYPQMAMATTLAEKSGKPIDDVLKMRTEDKMGWGKIAKELGVPPKEIGQSVAATRHEFRAEKRAERESKREEKREARMNRKEAKQDEKASHSKH